MAKEDVPTVNVPDVPKTEEVTPGNKSTEFLLVKVVMIACILIAVASSVGKVPFTPDQVMTYLANVMKEAGQWSEVFLPYITGLVGGYAWLRTSLKKKALDKK